MFYQNGNMCFNDNEMKDINLCLKEYQIMIKMLLGDKKYPLNKTIRKLYKERLVFFDLYFINIDNAKDAAKKEIEDITKFKTTI